MGPRIKRRQLTGFIDVVQENVSSCMKRIPQQGTIFNMKQDDNETMDQYWNRLVDIERKCDFNSITAEENITYKFAATIKDKQVRDNFIKGPPKVQLVLETIELDNYNRKYGDKKPKNTNQTRKQGNTKHWIHQPNTETKVNFAREEEILKPEMLLLRKTKLVFRTHMSGTEVTMQ